MENIRFGMEKKLIRGEKPRKKPAKHINNFQIKNKPISISVFRNMQTTRRQKEPSQKDTSRRKIPDINPRRQIFNITPTTAI